MTKTLISLLLVSLLSGCASLVPPPNLDEPKLVKNESTEFNTITPPAGGHIVAAVYGFSDKTGQRKPSDKLAQISFAVTQGAEVYVIKALQEVGQGRWFKVVERVGLDNLTKERQIIRQARESVGDQRQLKPMMFAGVVVEGGIIGYDSNTLTGGAGARWLGIGPSTQYRQDVVTVNLRTVSVQTGEVLASVTVTKSIISVGNSLTVFKFFDQGTKAFESEIGFSVNEPVNYAVRTAIEQGVVEIIKEGERKGYWSFKREGTPLVAPVVAPVVVPEVKPEEAKKDEKPTTAVVPVKATEEQPKQTDTPVPQKQTKTGVTVDYVHIRREPTYNSERLMNLKPNTRVEIIRETKTHYLIKAEEREGWVVKGFIKVL
jgi:curli production assembly/transport component CsgG